MTTLESLAIVEMAAGRPIPPTDSNEDQRNSWTQRRSSASTSMNLGGKKVKNPFYKRVDPMSAPEVFLRILLTVLLVPIRLLGVFICVVFLCWPSAYLMTIGQDLTVPLQGWRRFFLVHFFLKVLRLAYFFCGFLWIKTKGILADVTTAPILVTAPHSSFWDPVLVGMMSYAPAIVTKKEVLSIPVIGKIISAAQPIWIERENPEARHLVVQQIKERARSGGRWWHLMLFPEATTSSGEALITFKPGAFLPALPVQPITLKIPDYMVWTWDSPGVLFNLWRVFSTLWTTVEIEYLPVYYPSAEEKKDIGLFANNVRILMAEKLGIPTSEIGFEDCRIIQAAKRLGLPTEVGAIGVEKIIKTLGIKTEQILNELKHFSKKAQRLPEGRITLQGFCDLIHVPSDAPGGVTVEAFMVFEKEGRGIMSFREYLLFITLAKKFGDEADIFCVGQLFGDAFEPFDYDELMAVAKIVFYRHGIRGADMMEKAAERLQANLVDWKSNRISDNKLKVICKDDEELGVVFSAQFVPGTTVDAKS